MNKNTTTNVPMPRATALCSKKFPTAPVARFRQGLAAGDTPTGTIRHRRIVAIPYRSNFVSGARSFQQEDLVQCQSDTCAVLSSLLVAT